MYTTTDSNGDMVSEIARVTGIFRTGENAVDGAMVLLPIDALRRTLHYAPDEASLVAVIIQDQRHAATMSERVAATVGARAPAGSWLLAGAGAALGGETSIWLLNTSDAAATVTLQPLGARPLAADKVLLAPNTIRRVRLTSSPGVGGYRIDSAVPITASWSLHTRDAVSLFAGVALEG